MISTNTKDNYLNAINAYFHIQINFILILTRHDIFQLKNTNFLRRTIINRLKLIAQRFKIIFLKIYLMHYRVNKI